VQWFGLEALELTYKTPTGKVANELLYRHDESRLEIAEQGRPWSFDGDGDLFQLVSETQRIRLAHLFDPVLAVNTSLIDPLPHQITTFYEVMLPRQPLRFLEADDPGAGKTIMAGLLIKELIARGDLEGKLYPWGDLARIASTRQPTGGEAVALMLEESRYFIEWTAAEAEPEIAAELVDIQRLLTAWRKIWSEAQESQAQRTLLSVQAKKWSDQLL
jgi:hypothetical protein